MSLIDFFSRKKSCSFIVNTDGDVIRKYRLFRDFITLNRKALCTIAELEQIFFAGEACTAGSIKKRYDILLDSTIKLIEALNGISGNKYLNLNRTCEDINASLIPVFNPGEVPFFGKMVIPLEEITPDMAQVTGSKAANLAQISKILNIPVPKGFVITAPCFRFFLEANGLAKTLNNIFSEIDIQMTGQMESSCTNARQMILDSDVPDILAHEIEKAYSDLAAKTTDNVRIAMRSSAVGEDTEVSFAGQYTTELNVKKSNILSAYKSVIASRYTPRANVYRINRGFEDADTPMGVAGIEMIDSRASGVIYSSDPSRPDSGCLKISSVPGLGEYLVSGNASPDIFQVDKAARRVNEKIIQQKTLKLVNSEKGGTIYEGIPENERNKPSINQDEIRLLTEYATKMEEYFECPQDIEWAVDKSGRIFILQSRPLGFFRDNKEEKTKTRAFPDNPVLLSAGQTASAGTACGKVFLADGRKLSDIPQGVILVSRTASSDYSAIFNRVRGLVTDMGSPACHLASVAREIGVPVIVNTINATSVLKDEQEITIDADETKIYSGIIKELEKDGDAFRNLIFKSPIHKRLRAVLDRVSPLNLTDTELPSFSPEGCKTIHDIIRFSHEKTMKEMFFLSENKNRNLTTVKLSTHIPLKIYLIDLGGGLRDNLTTCDTITDDDVESIPMKAIWKGFTHPGITWSGTANFGFGGFIATMAESASAETGTLPPGGDSYCLLSGEYLNLSVKFGYHYANIDALCSDDSEQNHVSLQFSGGIGSYVGRTLRVCFLSEVLARLGFIVSVTGDLLEASVKGYDRNLMEDTLDKTGRLLASSRLLDMSISEHGQVEKMTEAFFNSNYDFLDQGHNSQLSGFYTHAGSWKAVQENGNELYLQDGSKWTTGLSSVTAQFMGRIAGARYQDFLDRIGAYSHFPVAIKRNSFVTDSIIKVRVKPVSGSIDRAGGLVFALRNTANYFVLRINALEDNFILFEFTSNRRTELIRVSTRINADTWYNIKAEVTGKTIRGYLDDRLLIEYESDKTLGGYTGMWTKADSVTFFTSPEIETK